jgi:hypothetical protein
MLLQPTDSIYARSPTNNTTTTTNLDLSPIVLEEFKMVFFALPPATLWKRLFRRMMGYSDWKTKDPHHHDDDPTGNGLRYLRDFSLAEANAMMTSPEYTRAIFVRDPLERFYKVFHETVLPQDGEYVRKQCCPQHQQQKQQNDCFSPHNVTPESFLHFLEQTKCQDIHWASVAERMEYKYWNYINFIGHWDRVDQDSQKLLEQLGVWNLVGSSGWGKDGNLTFSAQLMEVYQPRRRWQRVKPFYKDSSREILVNQVYYQDYDIFGFSSSRKQLLVQPTDYIYARDLRQWDAAPVVVERFRLVFFTVPKNACTTWKMLFRRMHGAQNYQDQDERRGLPHNPTRNGLRYLSEYSLDEANRIMTSPDYTRAIFVRDPKNRFLSAYLDKAVADPDFVQRKCCRNTTDIRYQELACSGQVPNSTPWQFLDLIHQCSDAHWLPQHYRMEEKYWPFINFVGRHGHVEVDAKTLLQQIGAWDEYGQQGWGASLREPIFHKESSQRLNHTTDSKQKYHMYFTPELEREVGEFYAVDYQNPKLGFSVVGAETNGG